MAKEKEYTYDREAEYRLAKELYYFFTHFADLFFCRWHCVWYLVR